MEDHGHHLTKVLEALKSNNLYAKMSKCAFGQKQVEYLRHVIHGGGVARSYENSGNRKVAYTSECDSTKKL